LIATHCRGHKVKRGSTSISSITRRTVEDVDSEGGVFLSNKNGTPKAMVTLLSLVHRQSRKRSRKISTPMTNEWLHAARASFGIPAVIKARSGERRTRADELSKTWAAERNRIPICRLERSLLRASRGSQSRSFNAIEMKLPRRAGRP